MKQGKILILSFIFLATGNTVVAQTPRLQFPIGQTSSLMTLYSSKDGNLLATTGFKDRNMYIWDVKTGKLLTVIENEFSTLGKHFAVFSEDGSEICLISNDPTFGQKELVWDIKNNRLLLNLDSAKVSEKVILNNIILPKEGGTDEALHSWSGVTAFSADNRFLGIVSDSLIKVCDLRLKQIIAIIKNPAENVSSIQFSPDGKLLLCSSEKETFIWHTADFTKAFHFKNKERIFFTKGPSQMIVAGRSDIDVYAAGNKKVERKIYFPSARSISFSKDRFIAATGSRAVLFNFASGSPLHQWEGVSNAWFHPNEQSVITTKGGSYYINQWYGYETDPQPDKIASRQIEIWDGVTFQKLRSWKDAAGGYVFMCESGDKVYGMEGGDIISRNITTGTILQQWGWHGQIPFYYTTISPDNKRILTSSAYINTWDSRSGKMLGTVSTGHKGDWYAGTGDLKTIFSADGLFFTSVAEGVWQLISNEGKLLVHSQKKYTGTAAAAFSNHSDKAVFIYPGQVELYNLPSLSFKKSPWSKSIPDAIAFSPNDSLLLVSYNEKNITEIRRLQDFTVIKKVKGVIGKGQSIFNCTGKQLITVSSGMGTSYIWNILNGRLLHTVEGLATFSPVQDKVVTDLGVITDLTGKDTALLLEGGVTVYDESVAANKLNKNVFAHFTPDGQKIIEYGESNGSSGTFRSVSAWDVKTGTLLNPPPADGWTGDVISSSGKKILYYFVYGDTTERIMNIVDLDKKTSISLPRSPEENFLQFAVFSPDDEYLLTATGRSIKKWEVATGKLLFTFFPVDSSGYMVMIPGGYYYCSQDAAKTLHYVNGMQVIGFNQLDTRYNRPDKVLSYVNDPDTSLINAYQNAWVKRIKRLGLDTNLVRNDFKVPIADIINRQVISDVVQQEKLNLHISAADSSYPVNRFNIWINEVPLFGMQGMPIKNSNSFDTSVSVSLSYGENRVETSVTNINGAESYRTPLIVKYIPQTVPPSKVYFIGIGINKFADSANNLRWCVQDIKELAKAMQAKYKSQFVVLDTLFNEKVTLQNVKALKQKLFATGINDKVIISYSGHGLLSKEYDYYLSSYNLNFSNPKKSDIPYGEIENLLDSIPARQKILFLDACNSGEVDKEELQKITKSGVSLTAKKTVATPGRKGGDVDADGATGKVGLQNSFELMQSLFVNVGKGTGAIIISASGGVQFAQEQGKLGHGVFTYSLLEALKKYPSIKIAALKKYIGDRVMELTDGLQKPTTRNETIAVDWNVW